MSKQGNIHPITIREKRFFEVIVQADFNYGLKEILLGLLFFFACQIFRLCICQLISIVYLFSTLQSSSFVCLLNCLCVYLFSMLLSCLLVILYMFVYSLICEVICLFVAKILSSSFVCLLPIISLSTRLLLFACLFNRLSVCSQLMEWTPLFAKLRIFRTA